MCQGSAAPGFDKEKRKVLAAQEGCKCAKFMQPSFFLSLSQSHSKKILERIVNDETVCIDGRGGS